MSDLIGKSLGRYHILEQLGEGGMAIVYKAYDTRLEREVAVKVIRTERLTLENTPKALKRFEREARALAKLTHPNIVPVSDYGESEGRPYLVMPYLPGGTLKRMLDRPMPWQDAVQFLLPVAEALDYAHSRNMVHRDVKPSNILLTERGQPMLTDFGIAKVLDVEETVDLTGTGAAMGTPEYMAPEQATAKMADQRADIYSLGIVLYEMVTGRKPYTADTPMAVLIKQATDPLPRPTQYARGLPERMERILLKALAKKPKDRYQAMAEFAGALQAVQGKSGLRAHHAVGDRSAQRPRSWARIGIVAGAVAIGALTGILLWSIGGQAFESIWPLQASATAVSAPEADSLWTRPADAMVMVNVPAGEFVMGDDSSGDTNEHPAHTVFLDAFRIDRTEVTNRMYAMCVNAGSCQPPKENSSFTRVTYYGNLHVADYPVINVNWRQAYDYCEWAGARLPTEAEWEKAARGPDGRMFPWGDQWDATVGAMLNSSNEYKVASDGYLDTAPVGSYPDGASPYGALDMAGNVWEWVADWYDGDYYAISPAANPAGPASGEYRILRGGSFDDLRDTIRSANRYRVGLIFFSNYAGFRCVASE